MKRSYKSREMDYYEELLRSIEGKFGDKISGPHIILPKEGESSKEAIERFERENFYAEGLILVLNVPTRGDPADLNPPNGDNEHLNRELTGEPDGKPDNELNEHLDDAVELNKLVAKEPGPHKLDRILDDVDDPQKTAGRYGFKPERDEAEYRRFYGSNRSSKWDWMR